VNKESWQAGEQAWFEYHCFESEYSRDAKLWYHSHQRVVVVREEPSDAWPGSTFAERGEEGQPKCYRILFTDGFQYSAFEDELITTKADFYCDDPPTDGLGVPL